MSALADYYLQMRVADQDFQKQLDSAIGRADKKLFNLQHKANIKLLLQDQQFLAQLANIQSSGQGVFSQILGAGSLGGLTGMLTRAFPPLAALSLGFDAISTAAGAAGSAISTVADALFSAGAALVESSGKLEQYIISMGVLLKSEERAAIAIRDLQEFAAVTPFQTDGLIQSVQLLMAYGFQLDKARSMLVNIGDAAAASPRGMEFAVHRISLALGQMRSAGKLLQTDLRQLTEVGIGANEILKKAFGMSVEDLQDAVKGGAISMDEVIDALLAGMDSKFGGMMERQSRGWVGMISTLKDNWEIFKQKVGEPLFEEAKGVLTQIVELLKSPEFDNFVTKMTAGMMTFVDVIKGVIPVYQALLAVVKQHVANAMTLAQLAMFAAAPGAAGGIQGTMQAFSGLFAANMKSLELDEQINERKEKKFATEDRVKKDRENVASDIGKALGPLGGKANELLAGAFGALLGDTSTADGKKRSKSVASGGMAGLLGSVLGRGLGAVAGMGPSEAERERTRAKQLDWEDDMRKAERKADAIREKLAENDSEYFGIKNNFGKLRDRDKSLGSTVDSAGLAGSIQATILNNEAKRQQQMADDTKKLRELQEEAAELDKKLLEAVKNVNAGFVA